jgi:hypothetical protein
MAFTSITSLSPYTFVGATSSIPGAGGLIPTPQAGDQEKFLKGDGTWAKPPIGSILQVVQTVKSDAFSSTTKGSYIAVSGLSVTVTPSATSNKILVTANITTSNQNNLACLFHLYRNGVQITPNGGSTGSVPSSSYVSLAGGTAGGAGVSSTIPLVFLDSPSTTSPVTYQIYAAVNSTAVADLNVNPSSSGGGGTPGGSSNITAMEIAA